MKAKGLGPGESPGSQVSLQFGYDAQPRLSGSQLAYGGAGSPRMRYILQEPGVVAGGLEVPSNGSSSGRLRRASGGDERVVGITPHSPHHPGGKASLQVRDEGGRGRSSSAGNLVGLMEAGQRRGNRPSSGLRQPGWGPGFTPAKNAETITAMSETATPEEEMRPPPGLGSHDDRLVAETKWVVSRLPKIHTGVKSPSFRARRASSPLAPNETKAERDACYLEEMIKGTSTTHHSKARAEN